ncbi:cytochrome d ubiquinol oxidase subunit II [Enterobacteriaceae bacterium H20N1]|uniref:Cytochrome d ubiquinol oxidase subunit II n=1 Tax=Dryocola boscaweniae TaxID=2925397 RepID=A0A9X3AE36_9ENTR|nr:cytochrome d ubiquinol oxidase subunit II [Dryocola boscaweniae]MCT4703668.1 cytochrome d ubiquinol oxidase subunit II [Dryocola boscaweniae]MCT4720836.1 cytochrome d ubiquinol oxidase subunit II [Dryocola boscaweniae]
MEGLASLSATIMLFSLLMYLMLDGTDLGVGMLFFWIKAEEPRRRMAHSILPIWDANETWLVLLAGGMLALFPGIYARVLSLLYIPVFMMLLSLVLRAMALEYRSSASARIRALLDVILPLASGLAAFSQGACAGTMVSRFLLNNPASWFDIFPVLCGLGLMSIYLLLGCGWIRWRIGEAVEKQAGHLSGYFFILCCLLCLAVMLLEPLPWRLGWQYTAGKTLSLIILLLLLVLVILLRRGRGLLQLIATLAFMTAIVLLLATGFYGLSANNLMSLTDMGSSKTTQSVVLIGSAVIIPLTLAYHTWVFWVFRGKVL